MILADIEAAHQTRRWRLKPLVQEVLEAEMADTLGAGPRERTAGGLLYRARKWLYEFQRLDSIPIQRCHPFH